MHPQSQTLLEVHILLSSGCFCYFYEQTYSVFKKTLLYKFLSFYQLISIRNKINNILLKLSHSHNLNSLKIINFFFLVLITVPLSINLFQILNCHFGGKGMEDKPLKATKTVTLGGVFVSLNSQKCSQHFSFIVFCVGNITLTQGFF